MRSDKAPLAHIEGIIWDLDNTLYRGGAVVDHAVSLAQARAAISRGADLEMDEAVRMAQESYEHNGFGGQVFIDRYGIDLHDFHIEYHGLIDEKIIEKSHETARRFEAIARNHILITHASRGWAQRVLDHLGLLKWFPPERILAMEDYNFRRKNECPSSFTQALSRLGTPPDCTMMVEDLPRNLRIPHEMGLTTVYIHHGRKNDPLPPYIDYAVANTEELFDML